MGFAVRAIAGEHEVDVGFAPGAPALEGKHVQLPEPSRVPSRGEIAVIRGWADSFALTAGCHDVKLHRRLAPGAGSARDVFEAIERARVEALGANRMAGMAENLTAQSRTSSRTAASPTSPIATRRRSRMRWPCSCASASPAGPAGDRQGARRPVAPARSSSAAPRS